VIRAIADRILAIYSFVYNADMLFRYEDTKEAYKCIIGF